MVSKKTIRVPLAADGIPVTVDRRELGTKGESPVPTAEPQGQGTPHEVVTDEVTVPVHSSIESSLTFELLRRQSTDDEEDEPKS